MITKIFMTLLTVGLFVWAFIIGMEKEAIRQCEVAQAQCEQYGACSVADLAICKGE